MIATVQQHAPSLLRLARRYSLCPADAEDAYQRALEIFLRRVDTLEPETMVSWLRTVVKHEALAVRESRQRSVSHGDTDLDAFEARRVPSEDERIARFEFLTRSAEALERLKPQEVRALVLKAQGYSYAEICQITGWTYTKVNRCLTEGRKSFVTRSADIESGRECERWAPVLSAMVDGEATARQLMQVRPHLRHCAACRATVREFHRATRHVAVLVPAAALTAGVDGGESSSHLVVRAYEAMAGGLHDRAVLSAQKVQAVLDAAASGKVAAAAASAAAVAGSGVAVVREVPPGGPQPSRVEQRQPDRPGAGDRPARPPSEQPSVLSQAVTRPAPAASPTAARDDSVGEEQRARQRRPAAEEAEFGFEGSGQPVSSSSRPGSRRASGSRSTGASSSEWSSGSSAGSASGSRSTGRRAPARRPSPGAGGEFGP